MRLMCYDQAGNMIRDKHVSNAGWMTYDAENKMVRHNAGNTLNDPSVYQYDADGRRKESYTDYNGTTRYIHGLGGELIYEYVSFDNWKEYAYRNGDLLVTASNQSDLRWLVKDHLGTPRIVIDKFGNKSRHDYLPFGEEIGSTIGGRSTAQGYSYPQSDGVKQQFTGYERDAETRLDFAQARYFGSSLGRFTSPDPYNIVLESQAENNADDARAKLNNYLSKPLQWNRYVYVINNPLNYTDPTGEILELTGTQEERDRAFKRLQDLAGKDAGLGLHTAGGRTFVIYNNADNLRKSAGDVGQVLADIIGSKTTVEFLVTNQSEVTNANGEKINLADRLAVTELVSKDRVQIFIKNGSADTLAFKMRNEWDAAGSWNRLQVTDSVIDAHELGHAWGAIKDNTYERVTRSNARHYPGDPKKENNNRSLQVENWQRSRLGLSLRGSHP